MKKSAFKFILLSSLMISGCTIDLKTKDLINDDLKSQSLVIIDNFFNFTYVENHAIAFGMLEDLDATIRMPLIFALPILATLLCFYFVWKIRKTKFSLLLPFFLILGGAYGNILDRAMHGYVTDFIHLHYFHDYNFYVFNVADILVNIGFFLLLFQYKSFNQLLDQTFPQKPEVGEGTSAS